jgi:hypothetical protein
LSTTTVTVNSTKRNLGFSTPTKVTTSVASCHIVVERSS